jgi:hypothetical protein
MPPDGVVVLGWSKQLSLLANVPSAIDYVWLVWQETFGIV